MSNYLDEKYAAIDGVLLSYNGEDVSLTIPRRLADMDIHTIGDGALMESQKLRQAIVPVGIKRIGARAFQRCKQLTNLYIPYSTDVTSSSLGDCPELTNLYIYATELSEQSYRALKASSRRANGSVYLVNYFSPYCERLREAAKGLDRAPAIHIGDGITRLFTSQTACDEKGTASLQRSLDGLSFDGSNQCMTEINAFMQLPADGNANCIDAFTEKANDRFLTNEAYPPIEKSTVLTFDDSKTKTANGKYYIFADIRIGYHFWQSKVPVVISGSTYYIYRRHYLTSDTDVKYIRREIAVFTSKGLVTDKREAREVYAKYKLLSIL